MSLTTEYCAKCGIPVFETVNGSSGRKIFRSFGTRTVKGVELYFCYDCYEKTRVETPSKEETNDKQGEVH